MKNKNGFSLVEILTVVTIIAVLLILLIPLLGKSYKSAVNSLKDIDKKSLIDGTKLYVNNLVNNGYNIVSTKSYDSSCNIVSSNEENKLASYLTSNGEVSGYKFVEYAANNDLYVTAEYLVNNGYFDNGCIYDASNDSCEKSKKCKVDKTCTMIVHFEHEEVNQNPSCTGATCEKYYTLGNYTVSIQDESKCVIK